MYKSYINLKKFGIIEIVEKTLGKGISEINILEKESDEYFQESENTKECKNQLLKYFDGKLKSFNLKLDIVGTDFQKKVWNVLSDIKYGETISYQEEAIRCLSPKSARAVGNANAKNKIPLIIPCHRVIRKNGDFGGYALGKNLKKFLLELEKQNS